MTALRGTGLLLSIITLIADQASKQWLIGVLATVTEPIEVTPFFNIIMVWNTGISFGLFSGSAAVWALVAMVLLIVVGLAVWLWRTDKLLQAIGLGLIIGGALGNVVDRLRYGAVADFFDFFIGNWHWPAFNIADSAITIGALVLIVEGVADSTNRKSVRSKDS